MTAHFLFESARAGIFADWAQVVVPAEVIKEEGELLDFVDTSGRRFPAIRHKSKGRQGGSYRVCLPFAQTTVSGTFKARELEVLEEFVPQHGKIPDPFVTGLPLRNAEVVESSAAELVERLVFANERETVVIWRRTKSMHPVIDYGVRWSRRMDDGWMPSAVFPGVERLCLAKGHDWMDIEVVGEAVKPPHLVDGRCAPTVWLRATYPAQRDEGPIEAQLRETVSDPWPVGVCRSYRRMQSKGRTEGTCRWLTLGLLPRTSGPKSLAFMSIYDKRPGAQALSANQAGTQRFGCAEGGVLMDAAPLHAQAYLRQMAGDEELRPIHFYEEDGQPLQPANWPGLRTHNRRIDWRNTKDKLWFDKEPPRVTSASKRTTDDEQHMDDLGIDAYLAAFDDPALEETRRMMLHLDAADTQLQGQRINSAARGVGRPLLSFANAAWLFWGDDDGMIAQAVAELTVTALAANWEGKDAPFDAPVKPVATIKGNASWNLRHPDTGEPMRAAAPYEHATCVAGLLAAAQVISDGAERSIAYGLAEAIGATLLHWRPDEGDGVASWPFIVACLEGAEDGQPLPEAWRQVGTREFALTRVTGGSWTTWTMPGIVGLAAMQGIGKLPEDVQQSLFLAVEPLSDMWPDEELLSRFVAIDPMLLSR